MNTIVKSGILDRRFCFHEGSPIPDPPELTPYLSRRGSARGELLHANWSNLLQTKENNSKVQKL